MSDEIKWGSREIAHRPHQQLARDAMGHYADIRSGRMYRGDDRRPPWLAIWAFAFALACLGIAALAGSPAPETPHGPGWEQCGKEWRC